MKNYIFILLIIAIACKGGKTETDNFLEEHFTDGFINMQGEKIDIELLEGKVIILNLWATWCKPCIREMPDLEEMQSLLPDDYMLLLGSDEELGKVRKFADESGFDMNFVSLKVSLESLGIYSLPTTLIIDNEGNLKERIVGAQAWNTQKQIDKIKSAVQ